MFVFVSACEFVNARAGAYGCKKKVSDFPVLQFQAVVSNWMWILGTKLRRAASTFD